MNAAAPHLSLSLLLILLLSSHGLWGEPLLGREKLTRCSPELLQFRRHRYLLYLCKQQPGVAMTAVHGLKAAVAECQRQMKYERWDCTQDHPTQGHSYTMLHDPPLIKYGYRESAFLLALSSAGVTWSVARSCAAGHLPTCTCDMHQHSSQQTWEWGGCSYSVKYGLITSRKLLRRKGHRRKRGLIGKMYRHNLKAGRLAVKKTLGKVCKCHGVSGSCQLKTCWKAAGNLQQIGNNLRKKFESAKFVLSNKSPNESRLRVETAKNADLVFFEESPSFCLPSGNVRTRGVEGRICNIRNKTHSEGDCHNLCCQRGHKSYIENYTEKCRCKFHWCCYVTCEQCSKTRILSKCN